MNTIYIRFNCKLWLNKLRDLAHFSDSELLSLQILQMCSWFVDLHAVYEQIHLQLGYALKLHSETIKVVGHLLSSESAP